MSTEENKTLVRRFFEEFCNARQLDLEEQLFAAEHTYHDPASPWVKSGPEGMRQLIGTYQSAFPDAHWTVESQIAEGNTVATRWNARGTHRADLRGLAPTGKSAHVTGIWMHRIEGGKIAESWNQWDMLGLLQQLGVISMPR